MFAAAAAAVPPGVDRLQSVLNRLPLIILQSALATTLPALPARRPLTAAGSMAGRSFGDVGS
jgi:hypothetical protein